MSPSYSMLEYWLPRYHIDNHSCFEFMSAVVLSGPEGTTVLPYLWLLQLLCLFFQDAPRELMGRGHDTGVSFVSEHSPDA